MTGIQPVFLFTVCKFVQEIVFYIRNVLTEVVSALVLKVKYAKQLIIQIPDKVGVLD